MANGNDTLSRQGQVTDVVPDDASGRHETLALAVGTTVEDESLALSYSLLADPQSASVMERRWWPYLLVWPVMMVISAYVALKVWSYRLVTRPRNRERWLLGPEEATICFDQAHPLGRRVRNGVATSVALDVIYSIGVVVRQPRTLGDWLVRFWLDQPDGQAVRNRLRITRREFLRELDILLAQGRGRDAESQIDILCLACGSAQAIIEGSAEFLRRNPMAHLRIKLVDLSEASLRMASLLARERGVGDRVMVITANLRSFVKKALSAGRRWDVVEMVGFLDYRSKSSLLELCGSIRRLLKPGGLFITAHINPSLWQFAVRWVINWPLLIRRWPSTFRRLLVRAGFGQSEVQLLVEPNHIHTVALCRRTTP